ncbi:MAG TPA: hypothetical protein PKG96_00530 [Bacilli bacterium]|jgi:hypothetical protein|nr:hypothetical protein [Bacilli bacterium]HOD60582.1 hypothetical protein [Bacilli bacterium]HPM14516.1 hypothetical protein [Bacilli bacterium]HQB95576.1 hypothetical protein [Bacilli bacterium]HQM06176.1 hypothetical protein [Bacilli bacterium]
MKQIIRRHSPYIILLIIVLVLSIIIPLTFSWLSKDGSIEGDITIGGMEVEIKAFFEYLDENEVLVTKNAFDPAAAPNCYDSEKGLLYINGALKSIVLEQYEEESEYNPYFLDDFKVKIELTPDITSYLRIKVFDEWKVTRFYYSFNTEQIYSIYHEGDNIFPFHLTDEEWRVSGEVGYDSSWYYDAETKYVYYTEPLEKGVLASLPFIFGGDAYLPRISRTYIDTCDLILNIKVEIVQANRFSQIWGIDEIPHGGS